MGLFDFKNNLGNNQVISEFKEQLEAEDVDISGLKITLEGTTLYVKGTISSSDEYDSISQVGKALKKAGYTVLNQAVVDGEDEEDDEDDEDYDDEDEEDDEDYDDEDEEDGGEQEYTVQKGDTLWGIAELYYGDGSKHKIISDYNDIEHIHPGDVLVIPSLDDVIDGRRLQTILKQLGYPVGTVDGIVGPKTIAALKKFQLDNDLTPNGRLDPDTQEALLDQEE